MQNKMAQDINQAAEGLATTVEASEGVVDSLCAQEWDEGLNMGHHHQEIWDVVVPGWVSGVGEGVVRWLVCSFPRNENSQYENKESVVALPCYGTVRLSLMRPMVQPGPMMMLSNSFL